MRTVRGVLVVALVSLLFPPGSSGAANQAANRAALNGEWKLNVARSSFANMPIPQHATLVISGDGNKMIWKSAGVDAGGQPYTYTFDGTIDGKPFPLQGASSSTTVFFKWENGALVGKWKGSHGNERISTAKVSSDGKMLTVKNAGTDAEQTSNWTEVWDKVGK